MENNIHVMAIPPHTSHIVQALGSTPYAQFKKDWQTSLVDWNFNHSGNALGKGDFFRVMWPAWTHAMTVANIQSVFQRTGIYPFNFIAINPDKFTPSSVTDSKNLDFGIKICPFMIFHLFFWHSFCKLLHCVNFLQYKLNCL